MGLNIDPTIFNEMVNVSGKMENLKDNDLMGDYEDRLDDLLPIMENLAVKNMDADDFKDSVKSFMADGDDREDAIADAKSDAIECVFGDGATRIWFVPDDSLLKKALFLYYDHVDHCSLNWVEAFKKFADGVDSPDHDGFYFTTGCGYSITDELFSGVPVKNSNEGVGSGEPVRKFLAFINKGVNE